VKARAHSYILNIRIWCRTRARRWRRQTVLRTRITRTWNSSRTWRESRGGVPFVNISGGFNIGNNFEGELPQTGNTFQWSDNFSKTIGRHDLKFGGDIRYQRFDQNAVLRRERSILLFRRRPETIQDTAIYFPTTSWVFRTNTDKVPRRKNWFAVSPSICTRRIVGKSSRNLTLKLRPALGN